MDSRGRKLLNKVRKNLHYWYKFHEQWIQKSFYFKNVKCQKIFSRVESSKMIKNTFFSRYCYVSENFIIYSTFGTKILFKECFRLIRFCKKFHFRDFFIVNIQQVSCNLSSHCYTIKTRFSCFSFASSNNFK